MVASEVYTVRGDRHKCIDTVFYSKDCDGECVRDSLINHDGYPSDIVVLPSRVM